MVTIKNKTRNLLDIKDDMRVSAVCSVQYGPRFQGNIAIKTITNVILKIVFG